MRTYEAHITLEPTLTQEQRKDVEYIAGCYRFHAGDIALDKNSVDAWLNIEKAYFVTGHCQKLTECITRTKELVIVLQETGYKVL